MGIDPKLFVQKPVEVIAIQVTPENIREIAEWCGGRVLSRNGLSLDLLSPRTLIVTKRDQALIGDWIVRFNTMTSHPVVPGMSLEQFGVYIPMKFNEMFASAAKDKQENVR